MKTTTTSMNYNKYLILVTVVLSSSILLAGCGTTRNTNQNNTADVTINNNPVGKNTITWLDKPELLGDLSLVMNRDDSSQHYYKIANLNDGGQLILLTIEQMGYALARLRLDNDGSYHVLTKYSDGWLSNPANSTFIDSVEFDAESNYSDLNAPKEMTVNNLNLTQEPYSGNVFFDLTANPDYPSNYTIAEPEIGTTKMFGETPYGLMYVSTSPISTNTNSGLLQKKVYYLKLADDTVVAYSDAKNFVADDGSIIGTFDANYKEFANKSFSKGIVANGCGFGSGDQITATMADEDLIQIGKTETDETLYTVNNTDSHILQIAYELYQFGRENPGTNIKVLSYEDFAKQQPVIIWQDAAADYLVFSNQEFAPMVECGKPVIYLYPTRDTEVSVQVAANITKSEPLYQNGWNVLAQPDGTLITNTGNIYGSLFWEGKGDGLYPTITSGMVVKQSDVETTIRQNLTTLGLNSMETQDFLDFWMPRMPHTNYVRLSWLDTKAMNQLAPLVITPKPDTILRLFLDFAGQDTEQTNLKPQILHSTPRLGFTTVEWGGLLVGE